MSTNPQVLAERQQIKVLLIILESLGSTELIFILVMALVFFGPRKLPQISRSLGKSLAEFRRASDDFKRTWEREVAMENPLADPPRINTTSVDEQDFLDDARNGPAAESRIEPSIEALPDENAVPRQRQTIMAESDNSATELQTETASPPQKRDWL